MAHLLELRAVEATGKWLLIVLGKLKVGQLRQFAWDRARKDGNENTGAEHRVKNCANATADIWLDIRS